MASIVINGDTSGSVTLQAPAAAGATVLTLPSTSGTVLTTASGQWITTGSDIYYNTGNVGINTATPNTKLDVNSESAGYALTIQASAETSRKYQLGVLAGGALSFYDTTAAAERMRITSDGLLQFNNGYGSVATAYGCRAWVNFNGTGTPAIRASGNVSSITDGGVGVYTINFTTALPDASYAAMGSASFLGSGWYDWVVPITFNTSSFQFRVTSTSTLHDSADVSVAIFR
jgi:hypothetical protein